MPDANTVSTAEKFRLIPEALLQAVIEYMAKQPWKDVGGAMPALLALREYAPPDEPPGSD